MHSRPRSKHRRPNPKHLRNKHRAPQRKSFKKFRIGRSHQTHRTIASETSFPNRRCRFIQKLSGDRPPPGNRSPSPSQDRPGAKTSAEPTPSSDCLSKRGKRRHLPTLDNKFRAMTPRHSFENNLTVTIPMNFDGHGRNSNQLCLYDHHRHNSKHMRPSQIQVETNAPGVIAITINCNQHFRISKQLRASGPPCKLRNYIK